MDMNNSSKKNSKTYPVGGLGSPRAALRLTLAALVLAALAGSVSSVVAAAPPERSLAGIPIFAPGSEVTRKFGNPNQILVGGVGTAAAGGGVGGGSSTAGVQGGGFSGSQGGFPGAPGGFGGSKGGGASFGGGPGSLPGFGGGDLRSGESGGGFPGAFIGGGFPGAGGGGFPGAGGGFPGAASGVPGGASGFPGSGGATEPVKPAVTLIYNRANGGSLEFTISPDKRVVQIRETGYSGTYGTARGIKLGTSYSAVVAKYGYPENTEIAGSIINVDYRSTLHCGFQFLDQRLVGIIVASPD